MNTNDEIKRLTGQFGDDDAVADVLEALEQSEPAVKAPPAAYKALMAFNESLNVA